MDVGRGVCRAQGCVFPVRQRVVELYCWDRVTTGDYELGGVFCRTVSWHTAQSALCSSASLWWEVARSNRNGCSVCCLRTRRLF